MLRALQLQTQLMGPAWRKASAAALRTGAKRTNSSKKPSLAAVWTRKQAHSPLTVTQSFKISRRSYSSQMPFRDLNKTDLEVIMAGGPDTYFIIDVREPAELEHGIIPSSHNVPRMYILFPMFRFSAWSLTLMCASLVGLLPEAFAKTCEEFQTHHGFRKPDQHEKIILCCKSGVRSGSAAKYLAQLGYKDVYNYPGYMDWFGRGY